MFFLLFSFFHWEDPLEFPLDLSVKSKDVVPLFHFLNMKKFLNLLASKAKFPISSSEETITFFLEVFKGRFFFLGWGKNNS